MDFEAGLWIILGTAGVAGVCWGIILYCVYGILVLCEK